MQRVASAPIRGTGERNRSYRDRSRTPPPRKRLFNDGSGYHHGRTQHNGT
jgi:hypothetical protein